MRRPLIFKSALALLACCVVAPQALAAKPGSDTGYYATPSWNQTLPADTRFVVLANMNGDAVLDKETGLVWEKAPSNSYRRWWQASSYCMQLVKGGRMGWRLPAAPELSSLIRDPAVGGGPPVLPADHPFTNVFNTAYWTATLSYMPTLTGALPAAWTVNMSSGAVVNYNRETQAAALTWCVRGGPGVDTQ